MIVKRLLLLANDKVKSLLLLYILYIEAEETRNYMIFILRWMVAASEEVHDFCLTAIHRYYKRFEVIIY